MHNVQRATVIFQLDDERLDRIDAGVRRLLRDRSELDRLRLAVQDLIGRLALAEADKAKAVADIDEIFTTTVEVEDTAKAAIPPA